LGKAARDVDYRIERARFVHGRTRRDWDEVVSMLERMTPYRRKGSSWEDRHWEDWRWDEEWRREGDWRWDVRRQDDDRR
jgi:hypothetical protein